MTRQKRDLRVREVCARIRANVEAVLAGTIDMAEFTRRQWAAWDSVRDTPEHKLVLDALRRDLPSPV